jgi:hypothetical protein
MNRKPLFAKCVALLGLSSFADLVEVFGKHDETTKQALQPVKRLSVKTIDVYKKALRLSSFD